MYKYLAIILYSLFLLAVPAARVWSTEDPDELYRKGRFADAEKIYATKDMDNPKDVRYRYNRGCAAYQAGDFNGAIAAFSSALRRAQDNEMRFRAAFNMGNASFKLNDFASSVDHFKAAIQYNPKSEDARHNLELALKALRKASDNKSDGNSDKKTDKTKDGQKDKKKGDSSDSKKVDGESSQPPNREDSKSSQGDKPKKDGDQKPQSDKDQAGKRESDGKGSKQSERDSSAPENKPPADLSGPLEALNQLPETEQDKNQRSNAQGSALSLVDRNRAKALLDNIQENPARFFRFQVPNEKRQGVASGRDW